MELMKIRLSKSALMTGQIIRLDLIFQNLWLLSAVSAHSATLAGKQRRVAGNRAGRGLLPACISAKHTAAYAYLSPGR